LHQDLYHAVADTGEAGPGLHVQKADAGAEQQQGKEYAHQQPSPLDGHIAGHFSLHVLFERLGIELLAFRSGRLRGHRARSDLATHAAQAADQPRLPKTMFRMAKTVMPVGRRAGMKSLEVRRKATGPAALA